MKTLNCEPSWSHKEITCLLALYEKHMDNLKLNESRNHFWDDIAELMKDKGLQVIEIQINLNI